MGNINKFHGLWFSFDLNFFEFLFIYSIACLNVLQFNQNKYENFYNKSLHM